MKIGINLTDYYRGSVGGIRVYLIALIKYLTILSTDDKFYVVCRPEGVKDFKFKGIKFVIVDNNLKKDELSSKLIEIISVKKLDLWFSPLLILDPLNCPIPSIFVIPDMQHETYPIFFDKNVLKWRQKRMSQSALSADSIITISDFSKRDIVKYLNVSPNKVDVTYLGVPYWHYEKYNKKTNQQIVNKFKLNQHNYFFFPANTWPHKNFVRLLKAFISIKDKYPKLELVLVVQSSNIDPKLRKIIIKNHLEKRVKFLGFVEDKYMQYIFKNSLGVIFPSLFEGFGIPCVEAMKNKVPVACSNTTSLPEICGNAALYFDPTSVEEISSSMEQLITNPKLRKKLINNGNKQVKLFSYKKTAQKTLKIFHRIKNKFDNKFEIKKYPKISIITPSFNQGLFIEKTIKSVINQNYPNLEYIVMDGGSTDNTIDILKKYGSKIIWQSQKDNGQTNAINKGLTIATGEIIGYINSDDTYEPNSLLEIAQYFVSHPKEKFVYGLGKLIDKEDNYISDYHNNPATFNTLKQSCDISQPSPFWKKSLSDEIGQFNEKFDYAMDYEYWVRISKKYKLNYIKKYLSNTRIHDQTKTNSQSKKVHLNVFNIQKQHYGNVEECWILSYTNLLLHETSYKKNIHKLLYLFKAIFIINFLQLIYNHKPITKSQLIYIVHNQNYKISLNSIKQRFNNYPRIYKFFGKLTHILFRDGIFYKHCEIGILNQYPPKKLTIEKFPRQKSKKYLKISIVTPSYNQGEYIKRTIDSILNQNYPNLEYYVQDGYSTDDTKKVLKKYGKKLNFESKKDSGQTDAINKAFLKTSGDIMAYLNSDDMYSQGTLQFVNDFFIKHPDIDVIYGNRLIVNQNDEQIGRWVLPPCNINVLKYVDYVPQETMFWRRSLWKKIGGKLDDSFQFAMDWDLIIKFINIGAKFYRAPYFLGIFRYHQLQKTVTQINNVGQKECDKLMTNLHGRPITSQEFITLLDKYRRKSSIFSILIDLGIKL